MPKKGRIEINEDHCKGCRLCISQCKSKCIGLTSKDKTNKFGYRHLTVIADTCTGCTLCAIMCPDLVIEVFRD